MVRAASLCSSSFPCAVRYSIPPRCSKPLIAQRSLGIGASDKSLYSALGISTNLRLLHFHAFLECRPCRHGAKQKHRVSVEDEVTCLTALFGLHVQRSVPHCLPCIVNCGFSGCIGSFHFVPDLGKLPSQLSLLSTFRWQLGRAPEGLQCYLRGQPGSYAISIHELKSHVI